MFNELNKIGFVVIDGINHYIYSRENGDMYLINGINGSVVRIDKVDLHRPVATPAIIDKSVALLEARLKMVDKVENKEVKETEI